MGEALLFPPPSDQLEATADCTGCGWHGTRFAWPLTARVGVGARRMEMPVGVERQACPECGSSLAPPEDPRHRHPSWPT